MFGRLTICLVGASLLGGCFGQIDRNEDGKEPSGASGAAQDDPPRGRSGDPQIPPRQPAGGPESSAPPLSSCGGGPALFGASPLRRHTNTEYDNTIADLLGDTSRPGSSFLPDPRIDNFANDEAVQNVSPILAQQYMTAAEAIATRAVDKDRLARLIDCAAAADEPCAQRFITEFGKRAYRRPLSTDEAATLLKVFRAGRDAGDFAMGIKFTLQAMLVSPQFLYRIERSLPPAGQKTARLDSWEVASRLSYFLLGSMPDAPLLAAAEAGKLTTKDGVLAEAKRLLETPRAKESVTSFFQQWLRFDQIDLIEKNTTTFPGYVSSTAALQRTEAESFASDVFWNQDGAYKALVSASYSFRNPALQKFYGEGSLSGDFQRVDTDPAKRPGILGLGGLAALQATPDATNPVKRGKFVREVLLCQDVPSPPPDLNVSLPKADPKKPSTARERLSAHSEAPLCASCHRAMDPIGLAFENLDGVGKWRTQENDKTIDVSGELTGTDQDGKFDGLPGLAEKLAASQVTKECAASSWFRYAFGRSETADDACTLRTLKDRFIQSGGKMKPFLLDLVSSDAFLTRTVAGGMP